MFEVKVHIDTYRYCMRSKCFEVIVHIDTCISEATVGSKVFLFASADSICRPIENVLTICTVHVQPWYALDMTKIIILINIVLTDVIRSKYNIWLKNHGL